MANPFTTFPVIGAWLELQVQGPSSPNFAAIPLHACSFATRSVHLELLQSVHCLPPCGVSAGSILAMFYLDPSIDGQTSRPFRSYELADLPEIILTWSSYLFISVLPAAKRHTAAARVGWAASRFKYIFAVRGLLCDCYHWGASSSKVSRGLCHLISNLRTLKKLVVFRDETWRSICGFQLCCSRISSMNIATC